MNILNNRPSLDLGSQLNSFRSQTLPMSPKERGLALDAFAFVRDKHNSFARRIDRMNVDISLKQEASKWERTQRLAREKAERQAKQEAGDTAEDGTGAGARGGGRKRGKRRSIVGPKRRKVVRDGNEDEDDYNITENGFHFIAYAPALGSVWKMDGMERAPRSLASTQDESTSAGTAGNGEHHQKGDSTDNWLLSAISDLQQMMSEATADGFEFSLMALTKRTQDDFDANVVAQEAEMMRRAREDWGPFIAHMVHLHAEKGDLKEMIR
jgi:ubiquitin carboxyl-terminal hydrolase L5